MPKWMSCLTNPPAVLSGVCRLPKSSWKPPDDVCSPSPGPALLRGLHPGSRSAWVSCLSSTAGISHVPPHSHPLTHPQKEPHCPYLASKIQALHYRLGTVGRTRPLVGWKLHKRTKEHLTKAGIGPDSSVLPHARHCAASLCTGFPYFLLTTQRWTFLSLFSSKETNPLGWMASSLFFRWGGRLR